MKDLMCSASAGSIEYVGLSDKSTLAGLGQIAQGRPIENQNGFRKHMEQPKKFSTVRKGSNDQYPAQLYRKAIQSPWSRYDAGVSSVGLGGLPATANEANVWQEYNAKKGDISASHHYAEVKDTNKEGRQSGRGGSVKELATLLAHQPKVNNWMDVESHFGVLIEQLNLRPKPGLEERMGRYLDSLHPDIPDIPETGCLTSFSYPITHPIDQKTIPPPRRFCFKRSGEIVWGKVYFNPRQPFIPGTSTHWRR